MKPLSEVIVEQVDKAVKANTDIKKIPNRAIRNAVINKVRDNVLTYNVDQLLRSPVDQVVGHVVEEVLTDVKLLSSKSKVTPLSARSSTPVYSGSKSGNGSKGSSVSSSIQSGSKSGNGSKGSSYSAPIRSGSGDKGGGKISAQETAMSVTASPSRLKPAFGGFTKPIL
jgi:hypothetical protein